MTRCFSIVAAIWLIAGWSAVAAGNPNAAIRAAQTDLQVFCPVVEKSIIEWPTLLYLNQNHGAEIIIGFIHPAPLFECRVTSTADGLFHRAEIGWPEGLPDTLMADSIMAALFPLRPPDIAIIGPAPSEDSLRLHGVVMRLAQQSQADTMALFRLERAFLAGQDAMLPADVIVNDRELYQTYRSQFKPLELLFGDTGPQAYVPEQFHRFIKIPLSIDDTARTDGFVSGLDVFRLPEMVAGGVTDSLAKREILTRLDKFRSFLRAALEQPEGSLSQIQLLSSAGDEISQIETVLGNIVGAGKSAALLEAARKARQKTLQALIEAVGITWKSRLETKPTPLGTTAKLVLDLEVTGSAPIDLLAVLAPVSGRPSAAVDTIAKTVMPHQRFYREYPFDWRLVDSLGISPDSLRFTVQIGVEKLLMELPIPMQKYSDVELGLHFIPGYTFLSPFTKSDITALAQPFDWQLVITKPFRSELTGQLRIEAPEGIAVGSFDPEITMSPGVTAKYMSFYFAAGRSVGGELNIIRASLDVGGQRVAETAAPVRVVRCEIPSTTDIAYIPDAAGELEDFLRMTKASVQPLTPHGLIGANLDAYEVLVIGGDAATYYTALMNARDRLSNYVKNGGEVVILGQSFGWPAELFGVPIYSARTDSPHAAQLLLPEHPLWKSPYQINGAGLDSLVTMVGYAFPARIPGASEIVSAGEPGSYLAVVKVGDGHVIYCGLPLLELAARLDVEAIHLLANLLNFGHGN